MKKFGRENTKTAYTNAQAKVYDETRFQSKAGAEIHRIELAKVMSVLSRVDKSARIVEVGCGTGRLLVECLNHGYQVDGMDASSSMLAELRDKLKEQGARIQLKVGDAADLPYEDDAYDVAYSVRLLNQTESASYALRIVKEMVRVVRPGGYVLIECVNAKRPRLGRNRTTTTRLNTRDIAAEGAKAGATLQKIEGAFFLGMGTYSKLGKAGVPFVSVVDRVSAQIFPDYCSRIYVLLGVGE